MNTLVVTAVVMREGVALSAYSYQPGEDVPVKSLCTATVEILKGKYDKGKLRKELIAAAKSAGIDARDIRGLNSL